MAIVSLVGKQLKNMIGISGKFFSVLGRNNINIEMISQGTYFQLCPISIAN
jgi:aspartate kinase